MSNVNESSNKKHFDSNNPYGSNNSYGLNNPYDPTITYQILEQLKLLGEEYKIKRSKKEQKKLVKHEIKKHLNKSSKHIMDNDYDEYDEYDEYETDTPYRSNISQTQHTPNYFTPNYFMPNRRRVNLLK